MKQGYFQRGCCPVNSGGNDHEPMTFRQVTQPAVVLQPFFQPTENVLVSIALCKFCGLVYGVIQSVHDDNEEVGGDLYAAFGPPDAETEEASVAALIENVDLVDLVGQTVKLKRQGTDYRGACPFHGGKQHNFAVIPKKQMFYCFVCHETGNAVDYLQRRLGITRDEAVKALSEYVSNPTK